VENRRTFLTNTMLAAAALVGGAVLDCGTALRVEAAQRTLYVWYRRCRGYRWRGVGPYTLDEAYRVENDYIRMGYQTYIGGRNG
jgi:hypothetical protein